MIDVNFESFDMKYKPIVLMAVFRMEDVLVSAIFLEILTDEILKSKGLEGELSKWKHASVDEIYHQIFPMVLHLNTYYTSMNVIGYGTAGTKQIFVNTKYLKGYSIDNPLDLMKIGSNLLHEDSHDKGFNHDFKNTSRRKNSLSYILNRAYERAFKKFYNITAPEVIYYTPWYKKLLPWNWF